MYIPEPGIRSCDYVSYMCSRFHPWFVALGYPRLDIVEYPDGEWAIIQYLRDPIIPCLTQWQIVLQGMRRVEISFGFVKKYAEELDMHRQAFWDREEAKSKEADQRELDMDRHREDLADKAHKAIVQNPALMERIARNGLQEMGIERIARHVPKFEFT